MSSSIRKLTGVAAVCLVVAAVGVSTALAATGGKKHSTKADVETTTTTTTTTTSSDATDPAKNTGAITAYAGGKLTVKLYGGTKVKAKVGRDTEILVEPEIDDTPDTGTSDDEDDTTTTTTTTASSARHFGGGPTGGPGGGPGGGRDSGYGYDEEEEDLGPQEGDTSDLVTGRVVEVGDLHAGPKGLTWTEILLR
jgi:hypothetical protein